MIVDGQKDVFAFVLIRDIVIKICHLNEKVTLKIKFSIV
jgi:hypothetical protein